MVKHSSPLRIRALGHYHPPHRITNDFFDSLDIGSQADWVEDRTGIIARHSVIPEQLLYKLRYQQTSLQDLRNEEQVPSIAEIAEQAWHKLCSRWSPAQAQELDIVICGTSIPDYDIPANACTIAAQIGAQCPAFDVNSACSSFVVNLHTARGLLQLEQHQRIAIFNPERYSLRIDYSNRASAVLFGDGCSTAWVDNQDRPGGLRLIDTMVASDPAKYSTVQIPDNGLFSQNGHAVQKFAITRTIESTRQILERHNITADQVAYFAGHQANLRMVESAATRLGISKERHLFNVDQFGNQGAAGAPCVLSMNWHKFKPGDYIVISVVGSGLTWGAALFQMEAFDNG